MLRIAFVCLLVAFSANGMEPPPAEEPSPPLIASGNVDAPDCEACDFHDGIGFGFLPHQFYCSAFYRCERSKTTPSGWTWTLFCCPEYQIWNQEKESCFWPMFDQKDCIEDDIRKGLWCPEIPTTVSNACYLRADPEDNTVFHYTDGNPYPGRCPPGTKFSEEDCACVSDGYIATCNKLIHFDFNDYNNPLGSYACNNYVHGYSKMPPNITSNGAACFNGVDQYIEFDYLNNFFAHNPEVKSWTFAVWLYYADIITYGGIFESGCETYGALQLTQDYESVNAYVGFKSGNPVGLRANDIIPANTWFHAAVTCESDNYYLYIDGELVDKEIGLPRTIANKQTASFLGLKFFTPFNGEPSPYYYHGCMDDFCFWPEALDQAYINSTLVYPGRSIITTE